MFLDNSSQKARETDFETKGKESKLQGQFQRQKGFKMWSEKYQYWLKEGIKGKNFRMDNDSSRSSFQETLIYSLTDLFICR